MAPTWKSDLRKYCKVTAQVLLTVTLAPKCINKFNLDSFTTLPLQTLQDSEVHTFSLLFLIDGLDVRHFVIVYGALSL